MKKKLFIVQIYDRFKDLVIKLIGVKATFVVTSTVLFYKNPESKTAFAAFFLSWCVLIGAREIGKYKGIIPFPKVE